MVKIQKFRLMTMGLILGCGGLAGPSFGAWHTYEAPLRLIHTDGALRLAEAQTTYGIRPADGASASPSSIPSSSVIKSEGGIPYVSGGVGESERSELKALASQFNLHLLFATQGSGEYLSAVRVNILDARRESVLTAESKGPWFYAQLPPGDYSLEVTPTGPRGQDETQRKDVHLGASGQSRVDFYWKK